MNLYYAPQVNQFVQTRGIHDDYWICGGFSEFFDDAMSTRRQQHLSYEFINECELVTAIDQCPHAELINLLFGLKVWKVIGATP